jgi:alpha-acetolactate decarboxylase
MLVKLHGAAIVIQQNFRKYKARKGFYTNSLTYINTSEDEAFTNHKDRTINDDRGNDPIPFSSITPEKVIMMYPPGKKDNPNKVESTIIVPSGNQFYSLNSSIAEKVVQLSVISSGRPDETRSLAKGDSADNSN